MLTGVVLDRLWVTFAHEGPRIIYGESVRIGVDRLDADSVLFYSGLSSDG